MISKEERKLTGLPEMLEFSYYNRCIVAANNMEDETLAVIKQLIQELEIQNEV